MRASKSASQARGSMSLSLAVTMSEYVAAARSMSRSLPANHQALRPRATPRKPACICIVRQTNPTIVEKACESLRVAGSDKLPMLWRQACQTGRGRHRDAGEHPAPLQSDPNGAGEVLCRTCETITQPLAPFHPIVRGRAGPDLLATIMHAKFGEHQPLNRQSERFAARGHRS